MALMWSMLLWSVISELLADCTTVEIRHSRIIKKDEEKEELLMVLPILAVIETPPGDNIINYFLLFAFLKFHRIISHRRVASRGSSRL